MRHKSYCILPEIGATDPLRLDVKRLIPKASELELTPVYKECADDPRNTDHAWIQENVSSVRLSSEQERSCQLEATGKFFHSWNAPSALDAISSSSLEDISSYSKSIFPVAGLIVFITFFLLLKDLTHGIYNFLYASSIALLSLPHNHVQLSSSSNMVSIG